MKLNQDILALDLGTTKFCLALVRHSPAGDKQNQVEVISVPAKGMRRGMLENFEEAKTALRKLVKLAEDTFNTDIYTVVVGVSGNHLRSKFLSSKIMVQSNVEPLHLKELIRLAESKGESKETEILHTVPVSYKIDSREPVLNPLGFSGKELKGDFFVIEADRYYLKDVVKLCNECGLEVKSLLAEPFASASVALPEEAKKQGCILADIGGGTTDGMVFIQGLPKMVFSINIAGKLMTSDLSKAHNISYEDAERIKIEFGLGGFSKDLKIDIQDLRGQSISITSEQVYPILAPRILELSSKLRKICNFFNGQVGSGVYLSGGGGHVSGIHQYVEKQLNIPVRKTRPTLYTLADSGNKPNQNESELFHSSAKFSTVLGLLNLEIGRIKSNSQNGRNYWPTRYLSKIVNWMKELS